MMRNYEKEIEADSFEGTESREERFSTEKAHNEHDAGDYDFKILLSQFIFF